MIDAALRSWLDSANDGRTDFPIQNLPHGVFRRRAAGEAFRGGVAIGDAIVDVAGLLALGLVRAPAREAALAAAAPTLNGLMALPPASVAVLRAELVELLRAGAPQADVVSRCLVPQGEAEHALPAAIGDFTDFFTSEAHMLNAGRIFQPGAPPLPNFKWLPIAYHGRASTVEVSGATFRRPQGQRRAPGEAHPSFGPTRRLDYELELAVWIGGGCERGEPIPIELAESHVFGVGLLNDWSARDVQAWEAMPLGPFLSKNFITTVSPWVVPLAALEPFRCALPRAPSDPPPLPGLTPPTATPGFDIQLEVALLPAGANREHRVSRTSFRHCYWSLGQMVAHHTEGGCRLRPGDLFGTGTQSGPAEGEGGCLLELTEGGTRPLVLAEGVQRTFLEDGDTVVLRAFAEKPGHPRIGFGECRGTVTASAS